MTPIDHRVIRAHRDLLYDPKGHGDLSGWIYLSIWPQKVKWSREVTVTYFMTPEVTVTFVVGYT